MWELKTETEPNYNYSETISKNLQEYEKTIYDYLICSTDKQYYDISIIELGCGYAYLLELLYETGFKICGVDNNSAIIDYCEGKGLDVLHYDIDKGLWFLEPHAHDYIILNQVLEHVNKPLFVLEEIYDKLIVGGKIILSVPNAHFMTRIINTTLAKDEYQSRHLHSFDLTQLVNLLTKFCKFKIEKIIFSGSCFPHLKGIGKYLDKFLANTKLFRRFKRRIIIIGVK